MFLNIILEHIEYIKVTHEKSNPRSSNPRSFYQSYHIPCTYLVDMNSYNFYVYDVHYIM